MQCPLRNDWREWDAEKRADRAFMICPACGRNGSHVNESTPRWVQRAQAGQLVSKDMTGTVAA